MSDAEVIVVTPEPDAAQMFIADTGFSVKYNAAAGDEQAQRAVVVDFIINACIERTTAAVRALELLSLLVADDASTHLMLSGTAHRLRARIEADAWARVLREDELTRTFAEALLAIANPAAPIPPGAELVTTLMVHDDRGRVVAKTVALKPKA